MQSQPSQQQQQEKKEDNKIQDQKQRPDEKPKDKDSFKPKNMMILRMQTGLDGLNFQSDYLNNQKICEVQRRISEIVQQ